MTLQACFDQLDTWTIAGVTVYASDALPAAPALPCLVTQMSGGSDYSTLFETDGSGRIAFFVEQLLLVSGARGGSPASRALAVIPFLDLYLAALVADWYLDDNLLEPIGVLGADVGGIEYLGRVYLGARIRMRWIIKV